MKRSTSSRQSNEILKTPCVNTTPSFTRLQEKILALRDNNINGSGSNSKSNKGLNEKKDFKDQKIHQSNKESYPRKQQYPQHQQLYDHDNQVKEYDWPIPTTSRSTINVDLQFQDKENYYLPHKFMQSTKLASKCNKSMNKSDTIKQQTKKINLNYQNNIISSNSCSSSNRTCSDLLRHSNESLYDIKAPQQHFNQTFDSKSAQLSKRSNLSQEKLDNNETKQSHNKLKKVLKITTTTKFKENIPPPLNKFESFQQWKSKSGVSEGTSESTKTAKSHHHKQIKSQTKSNSCCGVNQHNIFAQSTKKMRYSSSSSASKSAILDKNTTQYKALTPKLDYYYQEACEPDDPSIYSVRQLLTERHNLFDDQEQQRQTCKKYLQEAPRTSRSEQSKLQSASTSSTSLPSKHIKNSKKPQELPPYLLNFDGTTAGSDLSTQLENNYYLVPASCSANSNQFSGRNNHILNGFDTSNGGLEVKSVKSVKNIIEENIKLRATLEIKEKELKQASSTIEQNEQRMKQFTQVLDALRNTNTELLKRSQEQETQVGKNTENIFRIATQKQDLLQIELTLQQKQNQSLVEQLDISKQKIIEANHQKAELSVSFNDLTIEYSALKSELMKLQNNKELILKENETLKKQSTAEQIQIQNLVYSLQETKKCSYSQRKTLQEFDISMAAFQKLSEYIIQEKEPGVDILVGHKRRKNSFQEIHKKHQGDNNKQIPREQLLKNISFELEQLQKSLKHSEESAVHLLDQSHKFLDKLSDFYIKKQAQINEFL